MFVIDGITIDKYRGMDVQLHTFLTMALLGIDWLFSISIEKKLPAPIQEAQTSLDTVPRGPPMVVCPVP
jgi:hypothetical protein